MESLEIRASTRPPWRGGDRKRGGNGRGPSNKGPVLPWGGECQELVAVGKKKTPIKNAVLGRIENDGPTMSQERPGQGVLGATHKKESLGRLERAGLWEPHRGEADRRREEKEKGKDRNLNVKKKKGSLGIQPDTEKTKLRKKHTH